MNNNVYGGREVFVRFKYIEKAWKFSKSGTVVGINDKGLSRWYLGATPLMRSFILARLTQDIWRIIIPERCTIIEKYGRVPHSVKQLFKLAIIMKAAPNVKW
jgi:cellobiose-specific phosphotransferase system component IIC